ncbi:PaaX family transcriptional regulator [Nocardioides sp. AN3]
MSKRAPTAAMSQKTHEEGAINRAKARRSRTVLVSFLGAVVRSKGNWMPIAGTVDLMSTLGVDAPGVRTTVSRAKKNGLLDSEARFGARGYSLTPLALELLAKGDEVIWHARAPAAVEDGWCIVNVSVPESLSKKRHQLRSRLSSIGFGNVGTAMWIAPARTRPELERVIGELDLAEFCAVFVGDYVAGQELAGLVAKSWDLVGIDRRYRQFLAQFTPALIEAESPNLRPERAFVLYLEVVNAWRPLPFEDPGLPRDLLPVEWAAPEATTLFERFVELLEASALDHAGRFWPSDPLASPATG